MDQGTLPDTIEWVRENCLYNDIHLNLLLAYIFLKQWSQNKTATKKWPNQDVVSTNETPSLHELHACTQYEYFAANY